ncbi:MAG: phosphotransferase [Cephaloticoccus sp.]|nr:phosphotransferase [Cephaloticoccus sp.]MCF7761327.1 phosphotransferase [Cephaloticoccus sp.]
MAEVLSAYGLGPTRSIATLGGTATQKWAVTTSSGRYVVRVRPAQSTAGEQTHRIHQTMIRLAAAGLPVPRPLARPGGETVLQHEGLTIEVLTWIGGDPWSAAVAGAAQGVGSFLGRFHAALAGSCPGEDPLERREDHPDTVQPILHALLAHGGDPAQGHQLKAINDLLEQGRRELESSLYAALPRAVIHGDFHPGNVRFRGPEVVALYDFDYLAVQARVRDVVDALMFFASDRPAPFQPDDIRSLTQPFKPNVSAARDLLAGYQSIRPLTNAEWQALPLLLRSRWIQMRLRGSRKLPIPDRIGFVLQDFSPVIAWLDDSGPDFFARLRGD